MWVFLKATCLLVVNRPGFFVLQSIQICWKIMGLRVFAPTMYHEHCFLVTKTLSPSASLRLPASCPVAFCRCGTVCASGQAGNSILVSVTLTGQGPLFLTHLVEFLFLGLWWCHQEMPVVKDHDKAIKESISCNRSVICRPVWLHSSPVNSSWVWVPAPKSFGYHWPTTPWRNIWFLPGCTLSREAMVIAQDVMRRGGSALGNARSIHYRGRLSKWRINQSPSLQHQLSIYGAFNKGNFPEVTVPPGRFSQKGHVWRWASKGA